MREKDCYFSQESNHTIVGRYCATVLPNDYADEATDPSQPYCQPLSSRLPGNVTKSDSYLAHGTDNPRKMP